MTDTATIPAFDASPRFAPTLEGIALELCLCAEPGFPSVAADFGFPGWRRIQAFLGLRPSAEAGHV
ncbi:MAG: hypothetical protein IBJ15_09465 [Alphaproteobacteria bacterium]|nr:hypothetical protein [Alphaproteobacteria bacterium]